jgi:hypothetical protein
LISGGVIFGIEEPTTTAFHIFDNQRAKKREKVKRKGERVRRARKNSEKE